MSDTHDVTISGFDLDRLERELAEANHQIQKYAAEARQAIDAHKAAVVELAAVKQTMGELCESCGWSMRFPGQPCRCELERELLDLKESVASLSHPNCRDLLRERAEARELLRQCLKVMPCGYIPTHTIENLPKMISDLATELAEETAQRETLEGMYHKVISACLKCDPIAACQREDGEIEPPWEVIDRVMSQRDRLERELATALRDRDNTLSDWTQADTDTIRALHERNEAIEQRDRLALICGELIAAVRINSMRDTFCEATHEQIEIWLKQWVDKLAAAKGGTPNNCQRPELCLLTETCIPCAICPHAVKGGTP